MNKKESKLTNFPDNIDTRVALLEMSISHINETLIRMEKRFDKIDERLDKIDGRLERMEGRLDAKIDSRFFWLLSLQIASFVGLLGTIARVAHWI